MLPSAASVLVVVAHPDDESFGLGAVVSSFVDAGTAVAGVCFTHGEASTLGDPEEDLHEVRAVELAHAGRVLGIREMALLAHPDGGLARVDPDTLADTVVVAARRHAAELLVVFDERGITGHPDHRQATRAAVLASQRLGVPVLAWALPEDVAATLNAEFGAGFVGRLVHEIDLTIVVDRRRQLDAIACHASQSTTNPVLWRRLELLGPRECLRWLPVG